MQETRFIAEVSTYFAACDLIRALAAEGIQADITAGGVVIEAPAGTAKTMHNVCAIAGVRCLPQTEIELCESLKGREIVGAAVDAAIILTAPIPDA